LAQGCTGLVARDPAFDQRARRGAAAGPERLQADCAIGCRASRLHPGTIPRRTCRSHRIGGPVRVLLAKTAVETSDDIHAYKPFVDGLRAIAIISVVAGHLELPGLSGGFVGVDVFFVISGYLIINQIAADLRNGRFGLWDFWARRALRILPAFLLVVSACLVLGVIVLVQYEYRAFADSFFFSTIMQANHYFLVKQDYF